MNHPARPSSPAKPLKRVRGWRAALLLAALACTVGLYSIEATHNHRNAVDDLRCPVCHVVGHSALDVYAPDLTPALNQALLAFLPLISLSPGLPGYSFFPKPQTRAPPSPVSSIA